MTHALKTWPQYFKDIQGGRKNFELRKDDRPFKEGDTVILQEWLVGNDGGYSGHEVHREISYILRDADGFGLREGYCIIGFKDDE